MDLPVVPASPDAESAQRAQSPSSRSDPWDHRAETPGGLPPAAPGLREMTEEDIDVVARLETELFGAEAWSRDLLAAELKACRGPRADRRYVVVETETADDADSVDGADGADGAGELHAEPVPSTPRLLGYAGLYHAGGLTSADLLTIATTPAARGRGLASHMLTELVGTARRAGCSDVLLEVRQSNEAARRLYERHGFVPIGRRRRYYRAPREDAVVMRLELGGRLGPIGSEVVRTRLDQPVAGACDEAL